MKKQLFFAAVAVLFSTTAFSQLTVIPKVGATFTNWMISDDVLDGSDKPKSKFGMTIGAGLEIPVSETFAVQPELLFIQKGFKEEESEGGYEAKATTNLNYLELPVLAKFKFGNFYVNAGPSVSFGLGGKYKWEVKGPGGSEDGDGKVKFGDESDDAEEDDVYIDNALDFGVQLGAGAKVGPVVIDVRYGLGLTNTQDEPDGFDGDWSVKNSTFQLSVGYPIPLGGK